MNTSTWIGVTETLGTNLACVSSTVTQGTASRASGVVTFTVGSLAPGASATLTVTARATEDGSVTDAVSATASSADTTPGNDTASASTVVAEAPIVVSAPVTTTSMRVGSSTVATFTHANAVEGTGAFSAPINWGDGTSSAGTISLTATTYSVMGSRRYSSSGSHKSTATVTEIGAAAELLLSKGGDGVPDLPDKCTGRHDDRGESSLHGANRYADMVDDSTGVGAGGGLSLNDLRDGLIAFLAPNDDGGSSPSLLISNLSHRKPSNRRVFDVLALVPDLLADKG